MNPTSTSINLLPRQPAASDELRPKVQQWVSQSFVGELLKQVRNSPFKSELFGGGHAGDAYGKMYDIEIAKQVAPAIAGPLVDSIVRHIDGDRLESVNRLNAMRAYFGGDHAVRDAARPLSPADAELRKTGRPIVDNVRVEQLNARDARRSSISAIDATSESASDPRGATGDSRGATNDSRGAARDSQTRSVETELRKRLVPMRSPDRSLAPLSSETKHASLDRTA